MPPMEVRLQIHGRLTLTDFDKLEPGDLFIAGLNGASNASYFIKAFLPSGGSPRYRFPVLLGPLGDSDPRPRICDVNKLVPSACFKVDFRFVVSAIPADIVVQPELGDQAAGLLFPQRSGLALGIVNAQSGGRTELMFLDVATGEVSRFDGVDKGFAVSRWSIARDDPSGGTEMVIEYRWSPSPKT